MGFSVEAGVSAAAVFAQGILSFFSPCVLPLVPLYISYLAGGAVSLDQQGRRVYPRKRVMVNTLFFVVGISFTFFLLGFGFSVLGRFFSSHRLWFARISGIIMILFGLYQLGFLGKAQLIETEHRLPFRLGKAAMNPVTALILGFTFSFAWTPCVGPALGSVLLMVSSAGQRTQGLWLIGVYTLGFVIPFLAVGLFTGTVLDFFKSRQNIVRYTVKIGGALLILMGVMTFTGFMNGITSYLSSFGGGTSQSAPQTPGEDLSGAQAETPDQDPEDALEESQEAQESTAETQEETEEESQEEAAKIPAPDFTLTDQYGVTHTLSDYKGKTVFLNFWATWCGPCKMEMPHIEAIYQDYGGNQEELVVLGVANPKTEESPYGNDGTVQEVSQFLEDNGYTFPVVMDTTGDVLMNYGIRSFPTTFMIDREGNVFGYVSGSLTREMMESIIEQTMTGQRVQ